MDLFSQAIQDFSILPVMESWEDALSVFRRAATGRPSHWLLPARVCEAVGGSPEQAIPAVLATGCAHAGILLVDDMLDADPRGDFRHLGMPATSNLAVAFQSAALLAASRFAPDQSISVLAMNSFNDMFRWTAWGQFLDSQTLADEAAYWQIVKTKSSPFFGTACLAGALAGGGTEEVARQVEDVGCLYGEMIQLHDDMHDAMEMPANPDWVQGRFPLPILYASLVEHPKRERFVELNRNISYPKALEEAQEILIQCGAISYCIAHLIRIHQQADELMKSIPLVNPAPLASLLDEIIAPVHELFRAVAA
jgi:geranylgeranyl pyrophosphate synthase